MIPIIIICYNNYKYVENTINQLKKINIAYFDDIIILDNKSSEKYTVDYLKKSTCKVMHNNDNLGPRISPTNNKHIYDMMPDKFIITDPDLEFNSELPHNFIDILEELSETYCVNKIGFELKMEINEFYNEMFTYAHHETNKNLYEWEMSLFKNKIDNEKYVLHSSPIDTTFCLINKTYINNPNNIRIAGNFTAKHIPWYINNSIYNFYELYKLYTSGIKWSSINCFFSKYINDNFIIVQKKDQQIIISNKSKNIDFWKNYRSYQPYLFDIMDNYLDINKSVISLGETLGEYSIYCSRKSKDVFIFNNPINDSQNALFSEQFNELMYNINNNYYDKNNINVNVLGKENNVNFNGDFNFTSFINYIKIKQTIDNISIILLNTTNKNVINQSIIYSITNNVPVLIV